MQTPWIIHLDCAKWVLHNVSGMMEFDILYKSASSTRLKGYIDIDWASYKINDQHRDSSSPLVAEPYHEAVRSNQPSTNRAWRGVRNRLTQRRSEQNDHGSELAIRSGSQSWLKADPKTSSNQLFGNRMLCLKGRVENQINFLSMGAHLSILKYVTPHILKIVTSVS